MGRIIVEVMPKPEILDPQGKAVRGALPRQGIDIFTDVRQGKRFELTIDGPVTQEALADAAKAAETVLSNPIIEDVVTVYEKDGRTDENNSGADDTNPGGVAGAAGVAQ